MAPVIEKLKSSALFETLVAVSGQHSELVSPHLNFFGLVPDITLTQDSGIEPRSLNTLLAQTVLQFDEALKHHEPDVVLVHGDTTTCLAGALAAFHKGIAIGHVEAGLRSHRNESPFPEEANRTLVDRIARLHFAPTDSAAGNLVREGIDPGGIYVTGSTVVDALKHTLAKNKCHGHDHWRRAMGAVVADAIDRNTQDVIVVTMHRRENIDSRLHFVCKELAVLAKVHPEWCIAVPVHRNERVASVVRSYFSGLPNIHILEPLSYPDFVQLMAKSALIITDSGGIQEEAPYLGKPVLIARTETEREECLHAGAELASFCSNDFRAQVARLISSQASGSQPFTGPFGNGDAADKVLAGLLAYLQRDSLLAANV